MNKEKLLFRAPSDPVSRFLSTLSQGNICVKPEGEFDNLYGPAGNLIASVRHTAAVPVNGVVQEESPVWPLLLRPSTDMLLKLANREQYLIGGFKTKEIDLSVHEILQYRGKTSEPRKYHAEIARDIIALMALAVVIYEEVSIIDESTGEEIKDTNPRRIHLFENRRCYIRNGKIHLEYTDDYLAYIRKKRFYGYYDLRLMTFRNNQAAAYRIGCLFFDRFRINRRHPSRRNSYKMNTVLDVLDVQSDPRHQRANQYHSLRTACQALVDAGIVHSFCVYCGTLEPDSIIWAVSEKTGPQGYDDIFRHHWNHLGVHVKWPESTMECLENKKDKT